MTKDSLTQKISSDAATAKPQEPAQTSLKLGYDDDAGMYNFMCW